MISVFGCPGSHALQRRKDLGELSGQNCDFVFITEEDSGEEPFAQIAADIEKHVACPHLVLEDRAECIRRAILDGKDARVILLTGKGEETTMKRGSVFVPYPSDVELTLKYLAEYDKVHPAAPASSAKKAKKDFFAQSSSAATKTPTARRVSSRRLSRHTAAAVHAAARAHAQLTPVSLPHYPGF